MFEANVSKGIKKLLDEADDNPIFEIDNLHKFVQNLSHKRTKNLELRLKHDEDPEKFLLSEVDLDEAIQKASTLSASPDLIPEFLSKGGFKVLVELMQHPNLDIVTSTINVLQELTEPDSVDSFSDIEKIFIGHLREVALSRALVATIPRIKSESENKTEAEEILTSILEITDNLLEVSPTIIQDFISTDEFVPFLLENLNLEDESLEALTYFNVFSIELLATFVQIDSSVAEHMDNNCLLSILSILSQSIFIKSDHLESLQHEFLLNCFGVLDALLLHPHHRAEFVKQKGHNLCLQMINSRKSACRPAIKTLSYAVLQTKTICNQIVQSGGLKHIFGVLMRKGVKTKPHTKEEKEDEEFLLNIICSLLRYCTGDELGRVLHKFVENGSEKIERLTELHQKYADWLIANVEVEDQEGDRSTKFLNLADKGLAALQSCDMSLLLILNSGSKRLQDSILKNIKEKGIPPHQIYDVVSDFAELLPDGIEKESIAELLWTFSDFLTEGTKVNDL
eukprot:GHVP01002973.1.p1 GENE.GHVP01002973.1~~GHVP01002973.1.p1  ORF type:complete len:510 (+),score=111.78 GHVP01002973.1:2430-3959(+)